MRVAGLDPDTYKATVVVLPFERATSPAFKVELRFRPDTRSGEDHAWLALREAARVVARSPLWRRVDIAWVERGRGMSRRADFWLGAFTGALAATIPVPLNPLTTQEWKKLITAEAFGDDGDGNAPKPLANDATRIVAEREGTGTVGWSPDELDAFAIAWCGREMNLNALARQQRAEAAVA